MAKREFINPSDIDKVFYRYPIANNITIGLYERILDIKPVTEQDIVKPYLEKIQNKIIRQKQGGVTLADCLWEIEDYVNSLLSEQGGTE